MRNLYLLLVITLICIISSSCKKDKALPIPINAVDSFAGNFYVHIYEDDTFPPFIYDTSYYNIETITYVGGDSINFSGFNQFPHNSLGFVPGGSTKNQKEFEFIYNDGIIGYGLTLSYFPGNDSIFGEYYTRSLGGISRVFYSGKGIE